jgi:hypothetical protein
MPKLSHLIRVVAIGGLFAVAVTGCDLFDLLFGETLTVAERLSGFVEELNGASRDEIWMHFHDSDPKVNALKDPATWSVSELSAANRAFSWSGEPTVDNGDGTMTVTGDLAHLNTTLTNVQFTLQEQKTDNWKILEIDLDTTITTDPLFSVQ